MDDQQGSSHTVAISAPLDRLAILLATGLGIGFVPIAPGTFGSLLGVVICYVLIQAFKFAPHLLQNALLAVCVLLAIGGTWAATRAERVFNRKDAGQIVIDEVCGQLITFVFLAPAMVQLGGKWRLALAAGFVLFRLFDIFKPWPIKRLEGLGGGLGVMADDVLAGIYAAITLSILDFGFWILD